MLENKNQLRALLRNFTDSTGSFANIAVQSVNPARSKFVLLALIAVLTISGCDSDLAVSTASQKAQKPSIATMDKITAKPGDIVNFAGKNLTLDLQIFVNGRSASFKLNGADGGSFVVPEGVEEGLMEVSFTMKDKSVSTMPLLNAESVDTLPTLPISEENVCSTLIYKKGNGDVVRGTASCEPLEACVDDGQIDCLATEEFPSVPKIDLLAKVAAGASLGGIEGTACESNPEHRATIAGAPTGTTDTIALNANVSGDQITYYRYKIRSPADPDCDVLGDYSGEMPVIASIQTNFAAEPNGPIDLCVIGKDSAGVWQSTPTIASWTKNRTTVTATFSGQPTGLSNAVGLNVAVSGAGVTHYKYKIRQSSDPACSAASGYSSEVDVSQSISDNIGGLADGGIELCVIGKDAQNTWQLEADATSASWVKDTVAPTATLGNAPTATNNTTVLDITVAGTDVTHYKYKIRETADAACSVAAGYSAEVAAAAKITSTISALPDGAFQVCVIGRDSAGNWQSEASASSASWTKDTVAPTATISSAPTGTNNVTLLSATIGGAAVTHYKFKLRALADTACSNAAGYGSEVAVATAVGSDISAMADGPIELCVIGRDASGNWQSEATAATASWTKDTLPSVATLSGAPTGTSLSTALNVTVAGTDVVEYKYKVRESSDPACSSSAGYSGAIAVATHITDNISAKADGAIQICVIGKDSRGNWQLEGTATTASWTKDTTAPTATISNAPSATNNTTVLDVTIAGTDVTHYKYKIRESANAACSVAAGYSSETAIGTKIASNISALGDGALELCVIGRDAAGNWQTEASAATASWTKDTAAPTASFSGEPTGTNSITSLNIAVAGADVSHYKFKVRESSDPACSNSTGYSSEIPVATAITSDISGLGDGTLQLCVIGRDAYGNWQAEASATTASWTKDALPPAATLSGQPTGSSLSTVLNITVGGADVLEYKYKIRQASDLSCSDSTGYSSAIAVATHITNDISALADGVIQVCVIGKDASNNWQLEGTSTTASWTKDTVAPTTDITDEPTGTNATTTLNVTIAGTSVTHYKYKIREPATTACSNNAGYSSETAIASKITDSIASLPEGSIELCVIGRDAAGNWQTEASATTVSWTKDTTAPTATISGEPTGTNNTTTLNVTIAGTGVTHYKYKIRASADTACSNATGYSSEVAVATAITDSISGKADGTIELCVIGRDTYSNWQAYGSATAATWTKDLGAPSVNAGSDKLTKTSATINASVSDSMSSIATYAWTQVSGPGTIAFTTASSEDTDASADSDGTYVLRLTATDQAGNSGSDELNFVWDTTAPSNPSSVGFGSAYSSSTNVSMSWSNSTDSHFSTHNVKICTANDCSTNCTSATTDTTSPVTLTGVNGTSYYGCVQGEDSLGNKSSWVASLATIWVDTSAPTANSLSINSAATYTNSLSSTLTLSATAADEMYVTNTTGCTADGNWESYSTSKSWSLGQSNTTATVYVKFRDFAGNESSCINDTITHDSLAPSSHSVSIDSGAASTSTTSVTLTLAATDLSAIEMYVTNTSGCGSDGSWEAFNSSKAWTLGQTNGTATVYVAFRDAAGNVSSCVNDTITHVSAPPTSPSISIEAGATTVAGTTATLSLSASGATEMYITNTSGCSAGGNWESYGTSKSWVLSADQNRSATVYVKYRNSGMLESSCVSDSITVQSPNLLTNGDFELGDATGWTTTTPTGSGTWVVDSTSVNTGSYSAHTSSVGNSSNACITQSIDLTAATEDYIVEFNWYYGTQSGGDYAEFFIDATKELTLSGLASGWTTNSFLVTKGGSRALKWCYRKNSFTSSNGDIVRLDEVRVSSPVLMPPSAVSGVGSNATVALTITAPVAPPAGYLVLRGTSAVSFTPVNGTSYPLGALDSYEVIYKGTSTTPSDSGLTNGTTYYYAVYSYDASDNYSLAATTSAMPWGNYTPSSLTATAGNAQVALSWSIPAGGAQTGSMVVMQSGSNPTFTPTQGTSYSVGAVTGGTIIYKNTGTSYTKTSLTNGTHYYFKVWTYHSGTNTYSLSYASDDATTVAPCTSPGVSYGGACWFKGSSGASCNSTCTARSRTYDAAGTVAAFGGAFPQGLNCRDIINNTGLGSVSGFSNSTGDLLCSVSGSSATFHSGSGNTGNKTNSGYMPICACQ